MNSKWPKVLPELSEEQQLISNEFMRLWHENLASKSFYSFIEKFNHGYVIKHAPDLFVKTLEIGAGLGEHLHYEKLLQLQKENYFALELRDNMAHKIKEQFPEVQTLVGDCQMTLPFSENTFDRILAIHVLEHLPNLPDAVKEMHRLCHKKTGVFSVVIPCEGGWLYSLGRKISAQRLFQKKYRQSYNWFIEREHINRPAEIIEELEKYFVIENKKFFPFAIPIINFNLCIGLTLRPKE